MSEGPNEVPTIDSPIRKTIGDSGCGPMHGLSIEDQEGKVRGAAAGDYNTAAALRPEKRIYSQLCGTDGEHC